LPRPGHRPRAKRGGYRSDNLRVGKGFPCVGKTCGSRPYLTRLGAREPAGRPRQTTIARLPSWGEVETKYQRKNESASGQHGLDVSGYMHDTMGNTERSGRRESEQIFKTTRNLD